MTPKHLTQIWTALGALLVYYTLSAWSAGQGGPPLFSAIFYPEAARIEALFALIICSALLVLLTATGAAYAVAVGKVDWASRLPVVWLEGLNTGVLSGKVYQGLFLLAFVFLPIAGLYHFLDRFSGASVIHHKGLAGPFNPFCLMNCPLLPSGRYQVGDGLTYANLELKSKSGQIVDWLPILEPWGILALLVGACASTVHLLYRVFRYSLTRIG